MSASEKPHCITERQTAHGYWWRYTHSSGEPEDTLTTAIMIAADEARRRGKTYVVASTPEPSTAVYVFASDHPDASKAGISIMYQHPAAPASAAPRRGIDCPWTSIIFPTNGGGASPTTIADSRSCWLRYGRPRTGSAGLASARASGHSSASSRS
jgi:hypothetical protein